MQLASIHPIDRRVAAAYVAGLTSPQRSLGVPSIDGTLWLQERLEAARRGLEQAAAGQETGANVVSLTLAQILAAAEPSYVHDGLSLTTLEATIDRSVGMLLRPPSRLFADLGVPVSAARAMPIRIDASAGMLGGSFMPANLVPQLRDLLRERDVRFVRRLHDSGFDGVGVYGFLLELASYAADRGMGLFEAVDAVVPDAPRFNPPGTRIVGVDRSRMDRETIEQLTQSLKPPKRSFMDRITGRRAPSLN